MNTRLHAIILSSLGLAAAGCGDDGGSANETTGPATDSADGTEEGPAESDATGADTSPGQGPDPDEVDMGFSDEFDDASRLSQWSRAHEQEGYAALHSVLDVDQSTPGELTVVPLPGVGWFDDFQGPLLYKNVAGDFVVETFVTAGNVSDPSQPPTQLFNSAGLLVRDPDHGPGNEDWIMHNTGYQAAFVGSEGKTTVGSASVLTLVPGAHRLRLRICRVGGRIVLARQDEPGAPFVATHEYDRPDLPDELQVGLIVNGWGANEDQPNPASTPDLRASFDYIRLWHTSAESDCLGD